MTSQKLNDVFPTMFQIEDVDAKTQQQPIQSTLCIKKGHVDFGNNFARFSKFFTVRKK